MPVNPRNPMKITLLPLSLAGGLLLGQSFAAVTYVDWLEIPAPTGTTFTLVGDGGSVVAGGKLTVHDGLSFGSLPSSLLLAGGFWELEPQFKDTLLEDASMRAMEFRVVPVGGVADYVIEFDVPNNQPFVLAVGNLLKNDISSTAGVAIAAFSGSGGVPIGWNGSFAWDSGVTALTQEVDWDPNTGYLSPTISANGESRMAFFTIPGMSGENPKIRLAVPNGYGAGLGESIYVGLGVVIPEPGTAMLGALGSLILLVRRRRK